MNSCDNLNMNMSVMGSKPIQEKITGGDLAQQSPCRRFAYLKTFLKNFWF